MIWCGSEEVSKNNMISHMKKGDNLAFIPGGFEVCRLKHISINERL